MTSEKDIITGTRKLGMNANVTKDGKLDAVHSINGVEQKEGTIIARTVNPDLPDSKGLSGTERHKNASIKGTY